MNLTPPQSSSPGSRRKQQIALPECGLYLGSGVYYCEGGYLSLSGTLFTTWFPKCESPLELLDKVIEENQGNLVQLWGFNGGASRNADRAPTLFAQYHALEEIGVSVPPPDWEKQTHLATSEWLEAKTYADRQGAGALKFVKAAADKGLYSILIYTEAKREWSERLSEAGDYYLGYDFGEAFAVRLEEEHISHAEPTSITLKTLADDFVRRVACHVNERRTSGWGNIMATSASFNLDYEVAAGVDVPLAEDFAFRHLNIASALSRGLYRQYALPLWGTHMAHEHYSWLPYSSPHKFELLKAAFQQKYMAGCKIIINESGNWFLQAKLCVDSPMFELPHLELGKIHNVDPHQVAPSVKEAEAKYHLIDYHSEVAKRYRSEISDFYDFVKQNGTPAGQPETTIAITKGNYDLCEHGGHPNIAIAGAYTLAEENPRWLPGAPEKGWQTVNDIFFPRPPVLAPYPNHFLSGTPYGMVDIVSFAQDHATADFLSEHYKALLFSGWNTASGKQLQELTEYVKRGGTLFISIPHLSTNAERNYASYTVKELVNGGDFSELCGVIVKGKGKRFYWATTTDREGKLGFAFPRRFGIMATCLGEIEITNPEVEVLAVDDESMAPVLLRHSLGKGSVYFLNSWAYPGAMEQDEGPGATIGSDETHGFIGAIYRHIASQNRGTVWMTGEDGERDFVAYSYFPQSQQVCLQNIDFKHPHRITLHRAGKVVPFELAPGEFRIVDSF